MFKPSGKLLTAVITIICSTAFCLFGYDQGVLSGLIGADNQFGQDFGHPDANTQGLIVSVYQLGNVGGSILIFFFGDRLGRKKSILWATIIMLIGAILQTASVNRGMIYAARIITGFGNGANTSTVPVYQAETSTAKQRGQLIAIDSCIIIFGILVAYWMDYGCANISGPAQWRFPVGFQIVFIIIILVLLLFVPETPRFLHAQGRHDEAEEVTARLVGKSVATSDPRVRELSKDILDALALESVGGPFRFRELLQGGKLQNFRRMCISFASNAFQQLGGICVITYYLPKVLVESIGMTRSLALLISGVITTEYFLASLVQIWLVDKFNRRTLMFISSAGEIITMIILAITTWQGSSPAGIVGAIMIAMYNTFYAFGWLPIPFILPAEVCTLRVRAKGAALASVGAWIIEFMVVQLTPIMVQNIHWGTYILFAALNLVIIVPTVYFFFPEIANMRLEDVDHLFESGGITGGVLNKGGRLADRRRDIEVANHGQVESNGQVESKSDIGSRLEREMYEHEEKV
ncbi:hypothetical protein LTR10_011714 [Elasticomyces elasticus]|uniref:Major facilitator superfamily (MFS) profile domain-containing protein n=1 Tax=Exophiala sideris TaxID=1016849 RepID=A0ABR0JF98_9EURO|nr:hypothetical protein LTR10_011714 [Elasticomyces elasticus]KAK5031827.1 hypothetical protein LTS07_004448 [Exophiala sideris]KAK5040756.1 hypothetical protein LTR13_003057 [Exophiala sideris]KAK5061909.1 hypothetical protein LTR69_005093 [Exophiala sideris]KAK5184609.1 hypothetical protein LTR44_003284 [Eurotiomycetes sp. CCFEE 6388]